MLKIYLNHVLLISDKVSDVQLFSLFILVYDRYDIRLNGNPKLDIISVPKCVTCKCMLNVHHTVDFGTNKNNYHFFITSEDLDLEMSFAGTKFG